MCCVRLRAHRLVRNRDFVRLSIDDALVKRYTMRRAFVLSNLKGDPNVRSLKITPQLEFKYSDRPGIEEKHAKEFHTRRGIARSLVFRFGWNATAFQILNPEIELWFSQDGCAVVGYVRHYRTRVVAGAPVCDENRLAEIVQNFEEDASMSNEQVCWFSITSRLQAAIREKAFHAELVIGAQPVWNPAGWPEIVQKNASLRAQLNRARNKGVSISEWKTEFAFAHKGLQRCLDDWMASRSLPKLGFLTEPVSLDRLADRRIFVAELRGEPVGFLVIAPVPTRNGWLVEQIVRGKCVPNGTAELLVDGVMRSTGEEGFEYLTLGLVPLTPRAKTTEAKSQFWLRTTLSWVRVHGKRFYNFDGLDAFKAKFKPHSWEPLFALSNEPAFSLRTLIAIGAAFSQEPLFRALARTLTSAARKETLWLSRRNKG